MFRSFDFTKIFGKGSLILSFRFVSPINKSSISSPYSLYICFFVFPISGAAVFLSSISKSGIILPVLVVGFSSFGLFLLFK